MTAQSGDLLRRFGSVEDAIRDLRIKNANQVEDQVGGLEGPFLLPLGPNAAGVVLYAKAGNVLLLWTPDSTSSIRDPHPVTITFDGTANDVLIGTLPEGFRPPAIEIPQVDGRPYPAFGSARIAFSPPVNGATMRDDPTPGIIVHPDGRITWGRGGIL